MRYFFLSFLLVLSAFSFAQQRSVDDVLDIVSRHAVGQKAAVKSKSYGQRLRMLVPSSQILGSTKQVEGFYLFCVGDGQGFVVVSGDKRMSEVLGYADAGDFDAAQMPENVRFWMEGYQQEAEILNSTIVSSSAQGAVSSETEGVEPLLTTTWNQGAPYNALCPIYSGSKRAVTGCVATAMAQAMNYYQFPTQGTGSNAYVTSSYGIGMSMDFSATEFRWDLMQDSYASTASGQEADAVAKLMLACGVSVNMDYANESGAVQEDQLHALASFFGYDEDMAIIHKNYMGLDDWHSLLQDELRASRPLMLSGRTPKNYGHAFLIDGFSPDGADYPYYHLNWGWGGAYNGFFKMTNMSDNGEPSNAYTHRLSAIINFRPDDGITERSSFLQLHELEVENSQVNASLGEKLLFSVDTLMNCSNLPFTGQVIFYLTNELGERTQAYSLSFSEMGTGYFAAHSAQCTVPGELVSGQYRLEAFSKASGSEELCPISVGHDADTITIINDPSVFYPSMQVTNLEISKSSDRNFAATATNPCNFHDTPFSGTLQMIVKDYFGNFVTSFGSTRHFDNLPKYSLYQQSFSFSGELPAAVGDGAYRLYLGAKQDGYSTWVDIKKFTLSGGYITEMDVDLPTRFWVKNNVATLEAPFLRGDVNDDSDVNVADLSRLIRLILDGYDTQDEMLWAADLDENACLNVGDFSLLVKQIMEAAAASPVFAASKDFASEQKEQLIGLELTPTENEDEWLLSVNLNNQKPVNSMQFDLRLPTGVELSLDDVLLTERTRGFARAYKNGRVLLYNLADSEISGQEGAVLKLRLQLPASCQTQAVALEGIVLSDAEDCSAIGAADAQIQLNGQDLTAVESIDLGTLSIKGDRGSLVLYSTQERVLRIADAQGRGLRTINLAPGESQRVALASGVYIINNVKVRVK